jgi:hypothetical protein
MNSYTYVRQMKSGTVKDQGHIYKFYFIYVLFSFTEFLNMALARNLCGYVGTSAQSLCVEFYNFLQCHTFVNYLTSC